ncbi:MAG: hypothetical protein ACLGI3_06970 [Actinomycetes bacterium]
MTVVAVGSAKTRGVTTAAELLVLLRPTGRRCVLVDADPAGGDWLLRPGVAPEPGLVSLAMAGRRRLGQGTVFDHVQVVGGLELVAGPAAAHQASTALQMIGDRLVAHLRNLADGRQDGSAAPFDAVVDCGRLTPGSPALAAAAQADLAVLVSGATAAALVHLAPLVEMVRAAGGSPAVLLFGGDSRGPRYEPEEVAAGVQADVLGTMPDDPGAAGRLVDDPGRLDGLSRSRLAKSMTPVAARAWAAAAEREPSPAAPAAAPAHEAYAPIGWRDQHG